MEKLESPYPYFGGKSKVAQIIWDILGNVDNYVEPFMGSGIILLSRPHEPKQETVNDFDCYVANFWRSVKYNAEGVAEHCDWPVNETDLIARNNRLAIKRKEMSERMMREPYYFDVEVAGWWVWVVCSWVGGGYCTNEVKVKMPAIIDRGILTDDRIKNIYSLFDKLKKRLRLTHVACGDWSRVCTPTITHKRGITGVVLDPPYGEGSMDYAAGGNKDQSVAKEVQKWAIENGENPKLRIIYCGYEGQFSPPTSWSIIEWKAQGGYGSGKGTDADVNSYRERIWVSPHCLSQKQNLLFGDLGKLVVPKSVELKAASRNESIHGISGSHSISSPVTESIQSSNKNDNNVIYDIRIRPADTVVEEGIKSYQSEKETVMLRNEISGNLENESRPSTSDEKTIETIETEKPKEEVTTVELKHDIEVKPVCICSDEEPDLGCLFHFPKQQIQQKQEPTKPGIAKVDLPKKDEMKSTDKPVQKGLFG